MKALIIFMLLAVISCQDNTVSETPVEKVVRTEDDLDFSRESLVFVPQVKGIRISGEKIAKKGELTSAENLAITESSTNKKIDEYPLFDFGPVAFKDEPDKLTVYPVSETLQIQYQLDDKKKVTKKSVCVFNFKTDSQIVHQKLLDLKTGKPAYEDIFESLYALAKNGSREAFDFFINPNKESKEIHQKSESSVNLEPMINVLKFMKQNGCNW